MRLSWILLPVLLLSTIVAALDADSLFLVESSERSEKVLLVTETGADAYQIARSDLSDKDKKVFLQGHTQFNEPWVVAPDPGGVWGLGPTFNENRCAACHQNNGRAAAPVDGAHAELGVVVRLSVNGKTESGAPMPHPVYGDQLQNRGIASRVPPEGQAKVRYRGLIVTLPDGETVQLRQPELHFEALAFGQLGADTLTSMRVAPSMIGLGLLESVPEKTLDVIRAAQSRYGMGGRVNRVWDIERDTWVIGRFGWKASQPNLRQQVATAFHSDIGATSHLFPEENCPAAQQACIDLPSASKCGGQGGCTGNQNRPEVNPGRLNSITFYLQNLAVPPRRRADDVLIRAGEKIFVQSRCNVCHVPQLKSVQKFANSDREVVIQPYTDLMLHDMGDGLADHRPDFSAGGRDWRTAPLWGLGLQKTVSGHTDFLHDGRARNVLEAILWHGGQSEKSVEIFKSLKKSERDALVRFVESL